MPTIMKAGRQ